MSDIFVLIHLIERMTMRNWVWLLLERYCATCDTHGGGHKSWCPLA